MAASSQSDSESLPAGLFEVPDAVTDLVFEVEDRSLHFCRAFLVATSPVFARMFTADFKEREAQTIPLPDKKFADIVTFLMQLHPVHSWIPLKEEDLEALLKLADEYDVDHVKKKCEHFMGSQIHLELTVTQVMKYLWLSETFQLTKHQPLLLALAAEHAVDDLEASHHYPLLAVVTQRELMKTRCKMFEDEKDATKNALINAGRMTRKIKAIIKRQPSFVLSLPSKCDGYCVPCPKEKGTCDRPSGWLCRCSDSNFRCSVRIDFQASTLQTKFCKICVGEKTAAIVHNLKSLVGSIEITDQSKNMSVKFD